MNQYITRCEIEIQSDIRILLENAWESFASLNIEIIHNFEQINPIEHKN